LLLQKSKQNKVFGFPLLRICLIVYEDLRARIRSIYMSNQANKVAYFELPADDVARASAFYNTVFGWNTPAMGNGGVFALTTAADERGNPTEAGGINGDIQPRSKGLDRPLIMISVDDIGAQLQAVKDAGGKVVHPPQDETEFGLVWAVISDTEGNHVGVYAWVAK
jgi:uncharacterized protein